MRSIEQGVKPETDLTCSIHPGNKISFIKKVDNGNCDVKYENVLKCHHCFNEQNIPFINLIPLNLILASTDSLIYNIYPFNSKDVPNQIRNALKFEVENLKQEVQVLIKDIREEVVDKLDKMESFLLQKVEDFQSSQIAIQTQYNQLTQKKLLKTLLENLTIPSEEKKKEIVRILQVQANSQNSFEGVLSQFYLQKDQIDSSIRISKEMKVNFLQYYKSLENEQKRQKLMDVVDKNRKVTERMAKIEEHLIHKEKDLTQISYKELEKLDCQMASFKFKCVDSQEHENAIKLICTLIMKFKLIQNLILQVPQSIFGRIPISIKYLNSRFGDKIFFRKVENGIQLSLAKEKKGQAFTPVLESSKSYQIKIFFTKPVAYLTSGSISFGLIQDKDKDITYLKINKLGYSTNQKISDDLVLKGASIAKPEIKSNLQYLEVRFCIQKKIFALADISYQNINKVEESLIDPKQQYRFCFSFENVLDEMELGISEFAEIEESELPFL